MSLKKFFTGGQSMMDMTAGSPYRLIVLFSLPLLVGNVFQQLYNMVDSIVVGNWIGEKALAAVGTGFPIIFMMSSLFMGIGMGLKENNPKIESVEAQPVTGHYIQGLKNMEEAIVPAIYRPEEIDRHIMIDTEEAFETAREIVRKEGIFCGMSSGAAMLAAIKVAKTIEKGKIVVIFPDRGEKYLSTALFGQ